MKYFEFTFHTNPSTEIVNDVLAAVLGETGFESFVENENGLTAYLHKECNRRISPTRYGNHLYICRSRRQGLERGMGKEFLSTDYHR